MLRRLMPRATGADLLQFREHAIGYGLAYSSAFETATEEELLACYNGMGPCWFPSIVVKVLDTLFNPFAPAFLIHDFDFTFADVTVEEFNLANRRLYMNMSIINRYENRYLTYLLYRFEIRRVLFMVRVFGWSTFTTRSI